MSNFKKYMSVIQEMKVLPGLKDKINKFNFNDIYGNKIPGRVIIDSDILLLDLHATTGEDGLLIIKNKEGKEITPEKIDILIKLGKKWLSIYDTHVQSSLAERHKKLNSNQVLRMTNIDFTNNVMSMKNKKSTSLPVSPASDFFMPFSINYFVDKYNAKFNNNKEIDYSDLKKDKKFNDEFNDFIEFIHEQIRVELNRIFFRIKHNKNEKKDINISN